MSMNQILIIEEEEEDSSKIVLEQPIKKMVVTEDLGKIFEMAICLLYEIPYVGKYKYSMSKAEEIKTKIENLKLLFPYSLRHTAEKGNQYDFTGVEMPEKKLSAKSTKKDGKVCPQVIGQPSKKKFCQYFDIDQTLTLEQIKEYIQANIQNLLKVYFENTFDCSVVYYNEKSSLLWFINKIQDVAWENYAFEFSHVQNNKKWNESTTIKINNISIGEFQVHNHRNCIKFRWCFENLVNMFSECFVINII
jgi:hypothetical protein